MKFHLLLLIGVVLLTTDHVSAQIDTYAYQNEAPPPSLGTFFQGAVVHAVGVITKFTNALLITLISPNREVPLLRVLRTWENLPNPNFGNVIGSALNVIGFSIDAILNLFPSAILNTPIDVINLEEYLFRFIPPGTQTLPFGHAVKLVGDYTSQYFTQRVEAFLNSVPALA